MKKMWICVLAAATGLLAISCAWADTQYEEEVKAMEIEFPHELNNTLMYVPPCDVSSQSGRVWTIENDTRYDYHFKVLDKLPVTLSIDHEYIDIEHTIDNVQLPPQLVSVAFDIETTFPAYVVDKTYIRVGITPSFWADSWAFVGRDFRLPMRFYAIYLPNDQLILAAGLAIFPGFGNEFLPVGGVIYKPIDSLELNLTTYKPSITYSVNDKFDVFVEGNYAFTTGEYVVTRGDARDAIFENNYGYAGGGIGYKFNKNIKASFSTGGIFNRTLVYRGDEGKVAVDPGVYLQCAIDIQM
jgi:hypothetical protein